MFIPRGRRPWRPSPATRRWCRGVRFLLPQPSILPSARRQRSSPSQSGCCRGGGSAGPQGPVGPAASPPSPSAVPTSAQEIQPPGGGRASTARWGRRAPRAKGGLSPCGPGERGGGGRQGAAEATAGSLPPALGRGPGGAQAGLRPPPPPPDQSRRLETKPAAAYKPEKTDVWRRGRGEAPPPTTAGPRLETIRTQPPQEPATERTCAGALPRLPAPAFGLSFLRRLVVTCQAPTKENRAQGPGGQAFSLAWEQRAICSGSRSSSSGIKYNDSSGVLSFPGRWAAQTARSRTRSSN